MKKKLFAMYALVGALVASPVFTSCIDDTESASVTAVRTQKAEAMRIANQIAAANAEFFTLEKFFFSSGFCIILIK